MKKVKPGHIQTWSYCLADTPLGPLCLTFSLKGLAALSFGEKAGAMAPGEPFPSSLAPSKDAAAKALADYFAGVPTDFQSLTLDLQGTPFQLRVWRQLRGIPWGTVIAYQTLAALLDNPRGSRAVGQVLAANPLPIVVPCHRVIAKDGSLGGYSSGLDRKRWLLRHEGAL